MTPLRRRRLAPAAALAAAFVLAATWLAPVAAQDPPSLEDEPQSPAGDADTASAAPIRARTLEEVLRVAPSATSESLLREAASARERGERFRAYALATVALRAAEARGKAGEKDARRIAERRREWTRDLFPEEASCAAAWCGVTPELSLHYARRSSELGFHDDAAAEIAALLARGDAPQKAREEAHGILERARRSASSGTPGRARGAGGLQSSIYRVAVIAPLSGDYAVYGRSLVAGLRLALEDSLSPANALPVRIEEHDSHGDPIVSASAAEAAFAAGCGVVVGEVLSLPTFVLAGMCRERGVVLLSPSATDERIGELGALVLQTGLGRGAQAWALAEYAGESGSGRIAIARATDPESAEFAAAFRAAAESLGYATIDANAPASRREAPAAVDALRKKGADALLLPLEPGAAELWLAGAGREPEPIRLLGSEALDVNALPADARKRAEGITLAGLEYALPESVFTRVDAQARARYGMAADRFVRRGWLTGRAIGRALTQRAASPAQLATALAPRGPRAAFSGGSGRRFVVFPESEATIPLTAWRRGNMIRVR